MNTIDYRNRETLMNSFIINNAITNSLTIQGQIKTAIQIK